MPVFFETIQGLRFCLPLRLGVFVTALGALQLPGYNAFHPSRLAARVPQKLVDLNNQVFFHPSSWRRATNL